MNIIVSGGGTAGHIYPALALADELIACGHKVLYVGTTRGLESKLVCESTIDFESVESAGFDRSRPLTLITSSIKILKGIGQARRIVKKFKADAVVGFGGFVSLPVGIAASREKIALFVHEQNSVMGMTNKFLAKRANAVALTYSHTLEQAKALCPCVRVTGNPVRESVANADGTAFRESHGLSASDILILVFGGSRGALHINSAITRDAAEILSDSRVYLYHATGESQFESVKQQREKMSAKVKMRYIVVPYINDMGSVMAACDMVIARAGATSIAEITAIGKPSILIPYPYATDDHQTSNAQSLVLSKAALCVSDELLDGDTLKREILTLVNDDELRCQMTDRSKKLSTTDAAEKIRLLITKSLEGNYE